MQQFDVKQVFDADPVANGAIDCGRLGLFVEACIHARVSFGDSQYQDSRGSVSKIMAIVVRWIQLVEQGSHASTLYVSAFLWALSLASTKSTGILR